MSKAQAVDSSPPSPPSSNSHAEYQVSPLTPEHLQLKTRLSPLFQMEEVLLAKLSPENPTQPPSIAHLTCSEGGAKHQLKELSVNSAILWNGVFTKLISESGWFTSEGERQVDWDDPASTDPEVVLNACSENIQRLWADPTIKAILNNQKLRIEEMPGFFLDSLDRVTAPKYIPTDEDIIRARLKTHGVFEHRFNWRVG
jgi:hypothetical protein